MISRDANLTNPPLYVVGIDLRSLPETVLAADNSRRQNIIEPRGPDHLPRFVLSAKRQIDLNPSLSGPYFAGTGCRVTNLFPLVHAHSCVLIVMKACCARYAAALVAPNTAARTASLASRSRAQFLSYNLGRRTVSRPSF